jgi:enamine deaminase RidA (YjgF/YER057c/UK114 family)
MDDVVRCNVFLTDMANFTAMNAVYADNFLSPFSGSNDNQSCLTSVERADRNRNGGDFVRADSSSLGRCPSSNR